jgi:DNA-binding SARP family transcriptional activator/pimeloyl-ACP methyl ester carboxylesterase
MLFRLLGPLEASIGAETIVLGGGKQRALLARLLLSANQVVSIERLVDDLWGDRAPDSAAKSVQIYVSRLRKALPDGRLQTRAPGYLVRVEPGELDLHVFEARLATGREALQEGRAAEASEAFGEALSLWRGAALGEFEEPFAAFEGARLEELRLSCVEARVEAELRLGRHAEVAGDLESLVARYPLRERLRAQQLIALYRSGRQAEALAGYSEFRQRLDEELGIEPSQQLRELERQILRQDPALDAPTAKMPAGGGARAVAVPTPVAAPGQVMHARSGDTRIAYQVVGDGATDLVLVHGWVCTFQPGWEDPRIAHFYRRLSEMGRLILFDKRGTGLSDRVPPDRLPDLETRIDDVRAVMDAAGSERAVVIGISEGGPMSALFAATHPERTAGLVLVGAFARLMWAADYPIGTSVADQEDRLAALEADDWLDRTTAEWLGRIAPGLPGDDERAAWYRGYLMRGASPAAARALRLMNQEIDVRHVLPAVRAPTLVLFRGDEWYADGSRYLGSHVAGATVVELPGDDHLPWEGDSDRLLDEIERFLEAGDGQAGTDRGVLATILSVGLARRAAEEALPGPGELPDELLEPVRRSLARFRGREVGRSGSAVLAAFDGPARAIRCAVAIVDAARSLGIDARAGLHTGEVELDRAPVRGLAVDVAGEIAATGEHGEVLVSHTVKDLVAGSGIEFDPRGRLEAADLAGEWQVYAVRDGAGGS